MTAWVKERLSPRANQCAQALLSVQSSLLRCFCLQSLHRRLLANQKEVPVETGVSDTHKDLKQVSPTSGTRSNLAGKKNVQTNFL